MRRSSRIQWLPRPRPPRRGRLQHGQPPPAFGARLPWCAAAAAASVGRHATARRGVRRDRRALRPRAAGAGSPALYSARRPARRGRASGRAWKEAKNKALPCRGSNVFFNFLAIRYKSECQLALYYPKSNGGRTTDTRHAGKQEDTTLSFFFECPQTTSLASNLRSICLIA